MRVGITGHQHLADADAWDWVEARIDEILRGLPRPLVGLTSLAVGADQLFARSVLRNRGALHAVIPFASYETSFSTHWERQAYRDLLGAAADIQVLPKCATNEDAYLAAGKRVVDLSDVLIAVWDGLPARGTGGTADVVAYCRKQGTRLIHLDPVLMCVTYSEPVDWKK